MPLIAKLRARYTHRWLFVLVPALLLGGASLSLNAIHLYHYGPEGPPLHEDDTLFIINNSIGTALCCMTMCCPITGTAIGWTAERTGDKDTSLAIGFGLTLLTSSLLWTIAGAFLGYVVLQVVNLTHALRDEHGHV